MDDQALRQYAKDLQRTINDLIEAEVGGFFLVNRFSIAETIIRQNLDRSKWDYTLLEVFDGTPQFVITKYRG